MTSLTRRTFFGLLAALGLAPKVLNGEPKYRVTISGQAQPKYRVLIDPDGWVRRRVRGDVEPVSGRLLVYHHVGRNTVVPMGREPGAASSHRFVQVAYEQPTKAEVPLLYRCPDGDFAEPWIQVEGPTLPPIHDEMETYGWERAFITGRHPYGMCRIWQQGFKA